jgi:hypothetical protein
MLFEVALKNGESASWYLEESKDHPVHPHVGDHSPEYFLKQWDIFISSNITRNHLFILEGSLFQSTVRFMMEENNEQQISKYYLQCQALIAKVSPKLIYLRPPELLPHIDWVMNHRGEEWTRKVTEYLENTSFCSSREWSGKSCMRNFWSQYANLCDSLVSKTRFSSYTIKSGIEYYESQFQEALVYTNLSQGPNNLCKKGGKPTP